MHELALEHCRQITGDATPLTEAEIGRLLATLPDWKTYYKDAEPRLEKSFKFKDFREAMAFSGQLTQVINEEDHHPVLLIEWGQVTVTWWTHKIKGLHRNDFIMAAKTDEMYTKSR